MKNFYAIIEAENLQFVRQSGDDCKLLFRVLIAGEDRRARYHLGIDPVSILRALAVGVLTGRVAGLSTIEQQLARTLVPRIESPLRSKPRELLIALRLSAQFPKEVLWGAYLNMAYLGADWDDFRSARTTLAGGGQLDLVGASAIIACLKYPKPEHDEVSWEVRHRRRVKHLVRLASRTESTSSGRGLFRRDGPQEKAV